MLRYDKYDVVITLLDPLVHGAGTSGNTQRLRTQEVVLEDGRQARVPFVSGNSIKHALRDAGVRHALRVMKVEPGALSKQVVDLLFSGGHLSKGASAVSLSRARRVADAFPLLSLCGYSASNFMQRSKLVVGNLHLVCEENRWRMPESLLDTPRASMRAGSFRDDEFGTRHESKDVVADDDESCSIQMLYDMEVVKAGAVLWGSITCDGVAEGEMDALSAAAGGVLERSKIGARTSVGFGRVSISGLGAAASAGNVSSYEDKLRSRRDEILSLLEEVAR